VDRSELVPGVTVIIPTVPGRDYSREWAIRSARVQARPPENIVVHIDRNAEGPGPTRNAMLQDVATEWVAFLDDDDMFRSNHLSECLRTAENEQADLVYPWYHCPQGDPFTGIYGGGRHDWRDPVWDAVLLQGNFIPVTVLARTQLVRDVGGFQVVQGGPPGSEKWEDWGLWIRLRQAGAHFAHCPEQTWIWNRHQDSYRGARWR